MNISKISVKRPITSLMIILIIIILGTVSFINLQTDLFPNVNVPFAAIITTYFGASPYEVEDIVTKNIENSIASVSNIKEISSTSSENVSVVIMEFNSSTNMDIALLNVREQIDMVKRFFPEEVTAPMVIKFDPNMLPIMSFAVSKEDSSISDTTKWTEDILVPQLERIEGVASVQITGARSKEIQIIIDENKMEEKGIDISTIKNLLMANNFSMPAGSLPDGNNEYSIRVIGELDNIEQIKSFPLASQSGFFSLSDVAEIKMIESGDDSYSTVNGNESITINIQKESDYNTSQVAKSVRAEIDNITEKYDDVSIPTIFDQGEYIDLAVNSVGKNIIIGGILAILILLLFLRDIKPTFVIGVAIPVSVVFTFILVYFFDITLNIISLGGLALGIGMLVDDSVVVLENIYRMRNNGYSAKDAAVRGASQVAGAITASTLTTVSVFLPVVFLQGLTAQIFKEMALTVTFSLVASLFIALSFVPMLSSKMLKNIRKEKKTRVMDAVSNIYLKILKGVLKAKIPVLILIIVIFALSVYGTVNTGMELFPESDQGQISVNVKMDEGFGYVDLLDTFQAIEDKVLSYDEVDLLSISNTGGNFMSSGAASKTTGSIDIVLVPATERNITSSKFADTLRDDLSGIENAEINVSSQSMQMGFSSEYPISIKIHGAEFDTLESIALDIKSILENVDGITEIDSGVQKASPELKITLKKDRATPLGLTSIFVSSQIKDALEGIKATSVVIDGASSDVVIYQSKYMDYTLDDVGNIMISSPLGMDVPLSQVANIEKSQGFVTISRENQQRTITVQAKIENGYTSNLVSKDINSELEKYESPDGYFIESSGENEEIMSTFSDMLLALLLGVLLIYMIMASQFESLLHPFIIIFTVPLAFTVGFIGLVATGTPLSIPAFLGMIVLAGIVVNNGIVLVDYINKLRENGHTLESAIMKAGSVRLRPILMTALTTMLALLPVALGFGNGAEIQQPMGITVIGGLLFSTILTLIVVPIVYSLFDKLSKRKYGENVED